MATKFAAPSPTGDSGNTGDTEGSPWTVRHFSENSSPGDICKLVTDQGDYDDSTNDTVHNGSSGSNGDVDSGSAGGGYISYESNDGTTTKPVLEDGWDVRDTDYLQFKNLSWETDGTGTFLTDASTTTVDISHCIIDGCEFQNTSKPADFNDVPGQGLFLTGGDHLHIKDCKFRTFYGDDLIVLIRKDDVLIEDCDFIDSGGNHTTLSIENGCDDVTVKGCVFYNRWDRAVTANDSDNTVNTNVYFEGCVFINCDWNPSEAHIFDGWTNAPAASQRGAGMVVRTGADGGGYLNCLFVGSRSGKDESEKASISFSTFTNMDTYTSLRFAHCVIDECDTRGFFAEDSGSGVDTTDLKFRNCSVSDCTRQPGGSTDDGPGEWRIRHSAVDWTPSWEVDTCSFFHEAAADDTVAIAGESPEDMTATEANTNHSEFSSNVITNPSFVDDGLLAQFRMDPGSYDIELVADALAAYSLDDGTDLKGAGTSLTVVDATDTGTGTSLIVEDARWFRAPIDEYETNGSSILVAANSAVNVTAINYATNTLTIDTSISRSSQDDVYPTTATTSPSIGLWQTTAASPGGSPGSAVGGGSETGRNLGAREAIIGIQLPIADLNTRNEIIRIFSLLQDLKIDENSIDASRLAAAIGQVALDGDLAPVERLATGLRDAAIMNFSEQAAGPSATTSVAKIFAEDNGAGKTRLMAQFQTGSAVEIAIEV